MSEQSQLVPIPDSHLPVDTFVAPPDAELNQPAKQLFTNELERLEETIPEIKDRKESLVTAGSELIDAFSIKPEFFDDPSRSTIFASIAGIYSRTKKSEHDESWTQQVKQREFVANATFLLTKDHSNSSSELLKLYEKERRNGEEPLSDAAELKVFEKYTDPTMTAEVLALAEKQGWYREVLAKLGRTGEQDKYPVNLHVLGVGAGHEGAYFSTTDNGLEWSEIREWVKGLEHRADKLIDEVSDAPSIKFAMEASGFAFSSDGIEHMFIPMARAQLLLAEKHGIVLDKDTGESDIKRVIGTIKHEFVHTIDTTLVEKNFGWSIEEKRAEYFSGDNGEYYDVKSFFRNLAFLTDGRYIDKMFDKQAEARPDGKETSIYEQLGDAYGLDMVAKIAAVMPFPYVRHERSTFVKDMLNNLGSYQDIVREYGRSLTDKQKQAARIRISGWVEKFNDSSPGVIDIVMGQLEPTLQALELSEEEITRDFKTNTQETD